MNVYSIKISTLKTHLKTALPKGSVHIKGVAFYALLSEGCCCIQPVCALLSDLLLYPARVCLIEWRLLLYPARVFQVNAVFMLRYIKTQRIKLPISSLMKLIGFIIACPVVVHIDQDVAPASWCIAFHVVVHIDQDVAPASRFLLTWQRRYR